MDLSFLWEARSAAMVLGGTLIATLLRAGWRNCALTLHMLGTLASHRRSAAEMRSDLAGKVEALRRDGPLRAEVSHMADREFEAVTDALIRRRSIAALMEQHEAYRNKREERSLTARETLVQAAELGPVMGLAGTLVSLAMLKGGGITAENLGDAIGMAVATTLYGLLIAHFLFAPLAEMVSRRAIAEEKARQSVIEWLAEQLAPAFEKHAPAHEGAAR